MPRCLIVFVYVVVLGVCSRAGYIQQEMCDIFPNLYRLVADLGDNVSGISVESTVGRVQSCIASI